MGEIKIQYSKSGDAGKLYKLMSENPSNQNVFLDLSEVDFVKPNEIVLIVMFLIHLIQKGNTLQIAKPKNKKTKNYLNEIELIQFCNKNLNQSQTLNAIASQTAMPIRRLTESKMAEYIDFTKSYFQEICIGKDLTMLNLCMAELLNNVYNHSMSKIDAYVFCQYFPSRNEIQMVVGDYGIGIPQSVNNYLCKENQKFKNYSDIEALEWALQLNNSVKSIPRNQGKGLDNVLSFCKANDGKVFIYSNNAFMRINSHNGFEVIIEENYISGFMGTIVAFNINVANLDGLNDDLEEFNF